MKITVAETAGFCFGVARAVKTVQEALERGEKIATLGPIIHNEQFTEYLEKQGARIISSVEEAQDDETVIIRSHGVPKKVEDEIKKRGLRYIDATCPFVKKIHKLVSEYYEKGYAIVVIGDSSHPEVEGIVGWCEGDAIILEKEEDISNEMPRKSLCVVAQTTIHRNLWNFFREFLKSTCQNPLLFDTICSATNLRQTEAASLAKNSDVCIVIGGKHSSNTCKLAAICREHCEQTFHIQVASELPDNLHGSRIGITAGASTPDWIIKEVLRTMEEKEIKQEMGQEEALFATAIDETCKPLRTGDVVQGRVIQITPTEVIVDIGFKADGVIPVGELSEDTTMNPEDIVKVDDVIDVFVVRVNDGEGTVTLSKKKMDSIRGWKILEEAYENKTVLHGKVTATVNGGIIVVSEGVSVFVPASLANDRYLKNLDSLVGKEVPFIIINMEQRRRKIVGNVKAVLQEENKRRSDAFWAEVEVGKKYVGEVKSVMPFGVFVDIGGVQGLVHVSELSWQRVKNPADVMKEGDQVEVFVIEAKRADPENGQKNDRISLGYRKPEDNPWIIAENELHVGDVRQVKVVKNMDFGTFVEVIPGIEGLIHISQIANYRVKKPSDELTVGQVVDAQITDINFETKKISLSIRALLPAPEVAPEAEAPATEETDAE